ncbi:Thymus-specific serine protease [Tulasnella sp. 419]|nr:Thymus-specific serine protease [Tulasnella sp. 419]
MSPKHIDLYVGLILLLLPITFADPFSVAYKNSRSKTDIYTGVSHDELQSLIRRSIDVDSLRIAPLPNQSYYFDQLIDHSDPSLGTFKQRYFFNQEFYLCQGSPVVIQNAGEQEADMFWTSLTGSSMMRALMQEIGAAGVIVEHRYWGESSPFSNLTTANLKYLTLDQSVEDIKYFVENVKLPFLNNSVKATGPDSTPWIHIGCSFPGALAAFIQEKYPTLFAAAWASSALVQADLDFWEYYAPIEEGMPKNCSSDAGAVVTYIDGWYWLICNELGWWQTGDPGNGTTIISKRVDVPYNLRICSHAFPRADGLLVPYVSDVESVNSKYNGWNLEGEHLFATNGEFDPWRSASLSSKFGPLRQDTDTQKITLIAGGHHCWDWSMRAAASNAASQSVIAKGIAQIKTWLEEWYQDHPQLPCPST